MNDDRQCPVNDDRNMLSKPVGNLPSWVAGLLGIVMFLANCLAGLTVLHYTGDVQATRTELVELKTSNKDLESAIQANSSALNKALLSLEGYKARGEARLHALEAKVADQEERIRVLERAPRGGR